MVSSTLFRGFSYFLITLTFKSIGYSALLQNIDTYLDGSNGKIQVRQQPS